MCRVMATYPAANSARTTATARNAAGIPVRPVVRYAVGMTPAATVSGATLAGTKNSTAGTPSRSGARVRGWLLGLLFAACAPGIEGLLHLSLRQDWPMTQALLLRACRTGSLALTGAGRPSWPARPWPLGSAALHGGPPW